MPCGCEGAQDPRMNNDIVINDVVRNMDSSWVIKSFMEYTCRQKLPEPVEVGCTRVRSRDVLVVRSCAIQYFELWHEILT